MSLPVCYTDSPVNETSLDAILGAIAGSIPPDYVKRQRWFGSKSRDIVNIKLADYGILSFDNILHLLVIIWIHFRNDHTEKYFLPLSLVPAPCPGITAFLDNGPPIIKLESPSGRYYIYNGFSNIDFLKQYFNSIREQRILAGRYGKFHFTATDKLAEIMNNTSLSISSLRSIKAEQSNTSIIYNESAIMKSFRHLHDGINPDLEIPLFLTIDTSFTHCAPVAGYIEYETPAGFIASVAALQKYIPNQGDGWSYSLDHLKKLFHFALQSHSTLVDTNSKQEQSLLQFSNSYFIDITLLGQITRELHQALASGTSMDFIPEPVSREDVQIWINDIYNYSRNIMGTLRSSGLAIKNISRREIEKVASNLDLLLTELQSLELLVNEGTRKIRYHNDYHLGQVIKTENDFIIIDFEGEPARSLHERRGKHSPLKDVAGMLRSFNYASYAALMDIESQDKTNIEKLEPWRSMWEKQTRQAFLNGYLKHSTATACYLPGTVETTMKIISIFQIEKALYELNYEINNRPDWLFIPLTYLSSLLK